MSRELNEIDLKIISMFKTGFTTATIGKEVGKSKNSICGLLSRYREWGFLDVKRTKGIGGPKPRKPRADSHALVEKRLKYLFNLSKLDQSIANRAVPETPLLPPVTDGISFWNLTRKTCRYILNDGMAESFKFCGEPIGKGPYCLYHHSICYTKSERKPIVHEKRKW